MSFVGNLKLLMNRFLFFSVPKNHALPLSIHSSPSWLPLNTLMHDFLYMQTLLCPCVSLLSWVHWQESALLARLMLSREGLEGLQYLH